DVETAARIARLTHAIRQQHAIAAPAVAAERLHVSLSFVGAYPQAPPEADVAHARRCAAAVAMAPFVVALNRAESWKARTQAWPLVLSGDEGVIGIDLLRDALHHALAAGGLAAAQEPDRVAH